MGAPDGLFSGIWNLGDSESAAARLVESQERKAEPKVAAVDTPAVIASR